MDRSVRVAHSSRTCCCCEDAVADARSSCSSRACSSLRERSVASMPSVSPSRVRSCAACERMVQPKDLMVVDLDLAGVDQGCTRVEH